ncbi:deferrochelatase/peroxidase EfeB [Nakamurella flavida]|uniref:Deferrochelatase n=1 Tax=Nakamurella flavida TaxID=363630 RepID=A0A939C7B1_9ACTN|nr:iron uptake transporter deferrochelatase/peroxidase subunit [Nakamurella flavida]MBM9477992.1 deferrochelatase/peroxidase EfeB [Nakamurella flavida]MDP9778292.1 deferrochelatase/peroxidase EfeB [Nakamurella flavida]
MSPTREPGPSRRRFLGGAAAATAGLAVGGAAGFGIREATAAPVAQAATADLGAASVDRAAAVVPFYGSTQAGITTAQQERLMFASLDVTTTDVQELARMLGRWAAMAARFTAGRPVSDSPVRDEQPPFDTGEAEDLGPHSLTITVGFGPSLFDDRFGLADRMPPELTPFGTIPGDAVMKPGLSDGDLCIQACADDPQVVFHAIRNMVRAARGTAVLRWSQLGFGRASATGAGQVTPRNLFGFKDGTNNIHADDVTAVQEQVFVPAAADAGPTAWMAGGSYLVARKIRMEIESWDTDPLTDQERIFGRTKSSGAPLTGGEEFTPIDFAAQADGKPVIDVASHVRLAAPETNGGARLLRRGYNYTDGQDPDTGKLAAGLFFIAFQRDPQTQFKAIQTRLGRSDALNEYIAHIGGGLWACPPGVSGAGDWFGKGLLGDLV